MKKCNFSILQFETYEKNRRAADLRGFEALSSLHTAHRNENRSQSEQPHPINQNPTNSRSSTPIPTDFNNIDESAVEIEVDKVPVGDVVIDRASAWQEFVELNEENNIPYNEPAWAEAFEIYVQDLETIARANIQNIAQQNIAQQNDTTGESFPSLEKTPPQSEGGSYKFDKQMSSDLVTSGGRRNYCFAPSSSDETLTPTHRVGVTVAEIHPQPCFDLNMTDDNSDSFHEARSTNTSYNSFAVDKSAQVSFTYLSSSSASSSATVLTDTYIEDNYFDVKYYPDLDQPDDNVVDPIEYFYDLFKNDTDETVDRLETPGPVEAPAIDEIVTLPVDETQNEPVTVDIHERGLGARAKTETPRRLRPRESIKRPSRYEA